VVSGSGTFLHGETRVRFGPGDLLFVPAGVVHRFEEFSADFATWVLFYGPEGGEGG
jgi:mannose-6-phosphate isomerase-like protein (cupin superfamily)